MKQDTRELLGLERYFLWFYASVPALAAGLLIDNVWVFSGLFLVATLLLAVFARQAMRRYFGPLELSTTTRRVGVFSVVAWSLCHAALMIGKYYIWLHGMTVFNLVHGMIQR